MSDRRRFLLASAGLVAACALPGVALASGTFADLGLRGTVGPADPEARPVPLDERSKAFQRLVDEASSRDVPVVLPAGEYRISNITLPRAIRLSGVPGATRIVYGGDGHLFVGEDCEYVEFRDLVIDGANRWIGDQAQGLLDLRRVAHLVIDNCVLVGSGKHGISLERATGRIERCAISGAAAAAIYSVQGAGLSIAGNRIADCATGGIVLQRWQAADDGTLVDGNRIERIGDAAIAAIGISLFRADKAVVGNNLIADCSGAAIGARTCGDIRIAGNTCSRSGDTAIRLDLGCAGIAVTGNIVETAAGGIAIGRPEGGGAVCSGNVVRGIGAGVGIDVEADTSVTGNSIDKAGIGIRLGRDGGMHDLVATANLIRDARTGIAVSVADGAGTAIVTDNSISGASAGAVVGYSGADPVTGDLGSAEGSAFANLTVARNRVS